MAEKTARVTAVTGLAPGVLQVELDFLDPSAFTYRAGQFVSIRLDDVGGVRRSYSIASHPSRAGGFELLVKLVPGGLGSAYFERLRPGDVVSFTGPMGFFVPDFAHAGDVVFAATGSGIAAAVPMLQELLPRASEHGRVQLYWGLRHHEDLYWQDRLTALAALAPGRFEPHLSLSAQPPHAGWPGLAGRITPHVLATPAELVKPVYYLVGHEDMIREVKAGLLAQGIDRKRQLRSEIFYPTVTAAPIAGTSS